VPPACTKLFAGSRTLLHSHRGWDPGALAVARALARATGAPLVATTITRLLVDANRSPHNPRVFSDRTRALASPQRDALLARYHAPHWRRVREALDALPGDGPVLHLAVHSFTPVLHGRPRDYDVGLLYDPKRRGERDFAAAWQRALTLALGPGRVRRNAPYRGDADGLTTALRREHAQRRYRGIELEMSQALLADPTRRRALVAALLRTLRQVL
jgi:predicted N-formylglutamate amidohydrolase